MLQFQSSKFTWAPVPQPWFQIRITHTRWYSDNVFCSCKLPALVEDWYHSCFLSWACFRNLLELVVLTKYENICDETTASIVAFSHFNLSRNCGKLTLFQGWRDTITHNVGSTLRVDPAYLAVKLVPPPLREQQSEVVKAKWKVTLFSCWTSYDSFSKVSQNSLRRFEKA